MWRPRHAKSNSICERVLEEDKKSAKHPKLNGNRIENVTNGTDSEARNHSQSRIYTLSDHAHLKCLIRNVNVYI